MGATSIWHWLILGIVVILLFGGSRFSNMMGDVAKGIKNFKKGLAEEEAQNREATRIEGQRAPDAQPTAARDADPVRDERA